VLSVGIVTTSILLPSSSVSAATGINHQINFQGKLVNPNGTNVTDGSYSIVFSIYNVASAGSALWTETQTVTLSNGIFQVNLGSVTALPGTIDFNTDNIYLGIKVGTDAEMTPRVQFTAVPQAFNAEKLGGIDKTGFIQNTTTPQTASFNITGAGTIGTTLTVASNTTVGGTLAVTGVVTGGTYNGQTISSAANFTGTLAVTGATTLSSTLAVTGNLTQTAGSTISAGTGYKINGAAAAAGTFLRGNGTNFVASSLLAGDIPAGSTNYIQNGTTMQTGNFSIQAANNGISGTVGGIIRAAAGGQTADLLQFQDTSGAVVSGVNNNGEIYTNNVIHLLSTPSGPGGDPTIASPNSDGSIRLNTGFQSAIYLNAGIIYAQNTNSFQQIANNSNGVAPQGYSVNFTAGDITHPLSFGLRVQNNNGITTFNVSPHGSTSISNYAANDISLILKGAPSQAADLLQFQNSAGTVLAKVSSAGDVITNGGHLSAERSGTPAQYTSIYQDSGGGHLTTPGQQLNIDATRLYINTPTNIYGIPTSAALTLYQGASSSTTPGLVVNGGASSMGDLFQLQSNTGTLLSKFSSSGQLVLGTVATAGVVQAGSLGFSDGTIDGYTATVGISSALLGNTSFNLPGGLAAGAYTLCTNSNNCLTAPANGSASYIQNSTTQQAASNFNISGNGTLSGLIVNGEIYGQAAAAFGDVLQVGNDSKLVDINVSNTSGLYGIQDTTVGGVKLGSGGPTLFGMGGKLGIGTITPSQALDVQGGNINTSGQFISTVATGTAPFVVASTTKVTNLNADLLDGLDSTAFGDATAANQTTILSRIGTNADASGTTTLFARLASIDTTKLGTTADASSPTGSIFARLTNIISGVNTVNTSLGTTADAASTNGSVFARLASLITNIGAPTDTASSTGSLFAQVRDVRANLGGKTFHQQTITSSGTWVTPAGVSSVDVVVVGGGGSGASGYNGGGGGGGSGFAVKSMSYAVSGSVPVNIGSGGSGCAGCLYNNGSNGAPSSFGTITSAGGGGGTYGNTGNACTGPQAGSSGSSSGSHAGSSEGGGGGGGSGGGNGGGNGGIGGSSGNGYVGVGVSIYNGPFGGGGSGGHGCSSYLGYNGSISLIPSTAGGLGDPTIYPGGGAGGNGSYGGQAGQAPGSVQVALYGSGSTADGDSAAPNSGGGGGGGGANGGGGAGGSGEVIVTWYQ
jgi:hypothetical protein